MNYGNGCPSYEYVSLESMKPYKTFEQRVCEGEDLCKIAGKYWDEIKLKKEYEAIQEKRSELSSAERRKVCNVIAKIDAYYYSQLCEQERT